MNKPERSIYAPQDFLDWRNAKTLDLTPKFQRRGVWKPAARSFFIDTLLRSMPIPPIYVRMTQEPGASRQIRQVIDGQQRISCVIDFVDNAFRLSKTLNGPWAGKSFSSLAKDQQKQILNYSFSCELFRGIADSEVLEIFSRLNTYSVPLNAQELRNGTYFGAFKQSAYRLAYEHLEFWRRHAIFSERSIARMLEVELTSELIISQVDGMQDKKKSIDDYYDKYEVAYPQSKSMEQRFRGIIDDINDVFEETLGDTEFSRAPLFYTLFCAIYHYRYGLPNLNLKGLNSPKKALTRLRRLSLNAAVGNLSEVIALGRSGGGVPSRHEAFVAACLRQTDNIKPREERLGTLYRLAFK